MPRPRTNPLPQLSPGQASYVLDRLIADRRISPGEISRYVSDMHREIGDLERRLQSLREATGGGGGFSGGGAAAPARRGPGRPPGGGGAGRPAGRPAGSGAGAGAGSSAGGGARRGRRGRTPITAEQLASRQLQGRYLGLIRQIPSSRRGQYQKIAKDQGREAAIKAMQGALGK